VRSALVSGIIRGLVEELRPSMRDPGQFLSDLNHGLSAVLRQPDELIFVTAACVVADAATGSLLVANAGHPRPVQIAHGSGAPVRPGGGPAQAEPPLGIEAEHVYAATRHTASPGDRCFLFTDGLYEARSPDGRDLGEDRLVTMLARHSSDDLAGAVRAVVGEVESFAGQTDFEDDVCLVGVEFAGPAGTAARGAAGA
jgi:sigma-B regulation protein RsbU (phosphoserine phosphatase)